MVNSRWAVRCLKPSTFPTMHSLTSAALVGLLFGANIVSAQLTTNCPVLGPVLPAPTAPASSNAIKKAQSSFSSSLDAILSTGKTDYGTLDINTTSFSINIFSSHDNTTIFSYHYEAPGLNGSLTSGTLNDNTLYRIGSLSKLLTIYTLLIESGDAKLDLPVTNYVPELAAAAATQPRDDVHNVRWNDVTLRALGSHLSGIPRDCKLTPCMSRTAQRKAGGLTASRRQFDGHCGSWHAGSDQLWPTAPQ